MSRNIIKLKPIVEQVLLKEEATPTWGDVKIVFQSIINTQSDLEIKSNLKKAGASGSKLALSLLSGGLFNVLKDGLEVIDTISTVADVASAMLSVGKELSDKQLKNPNASEFKKLIHPLWDAMRLDPEVSVILDDKIEKQFIDDVIVPKLKRPGSENDTIPNMNYELGKWLNSQGLKQADIFFKGKEGEL
jgi:hypothetical protein